MKTKIFFIISFILCINIIYAQDKSPLTSKSGKLILPQPGDIAVGINASPFLTYFGNFFNFNANNTSPSLQFLDANTIYGKYFLTSNRALRVRVELTSTNYSNKKYVTDDNALYNDPLSNAQVVDNHIQRSSNIVLGAGYEYRRGRTRLQGFYGFEGVLQFGNYVDFYEYGNPFTELFTNPTDYNFGGNQLINGGRVLEQHNGRNFGIGAGAFVGIEYFIFPCISVGGQVSWNLMYNKTGKSKQIYEIWNGSEAVENTLFQSPGNRAFQSYTANPDAGIFFMFHF